MNEQNDLQQSEPIQTLKNFWIIIISVFITALIVGGGVYVWQRSVLKVTEQLLLEEIDTLQKQVTVLKQEQSVLNDSPDQDSEAITQIPCDKKDMGNYDNLVFKVQKHGKINVIVKFDIDEIPDGYEKTLAGARQAILDDLGERNFDVYTTYDTLPIIALKVDEPALRVLACSEGVIAISEDEPNGF